jgi:hypothetical protein
MSDGSRYSTSGGWSNSDKVRFRATYPEKIGGWQKATIEPFLGTVRNLFPFSDLAGSYFLGVGTNLKYYVERGGSLYDITPIRATIVENNPFIVTNGSTSVVVTIPNHGASLDDFVTFSLTPDAPIVVGGVTLNGEFRIVGVSSSSVFLITASSPGTSTASGGGSVTARFQINPGTNSTIYANGWGAGTWGGVLPGTSVTFNGSITSTTMTVTSIVSGTLAPGQLITGPNVSVSPPGSLATYIVSQLTATPPGPLNGGPGTYQVSVNKNVPLTTMTATSGTGWGQASNTQASGTKLRLWSSDNFGQNLVINPRDSAIYYWDSSIGLGTRAVALSSLPGASDVPAVSRQIIVSDVDRKVIAFGCTDLISLVQDRLLIRWSDTEDPASWTPLETNSAGGIRIPTGSEFITAVETKSEVLVWTDDALHSLRYVGAPFEYAISRIGMTSIIAPNAAVTANDVTFWMGHNGFFQYDGRILSLPCSVKDYVFNDINMGQAEKIASGSNMSFNEVWWFYPSANSSENDRYVAYNYNERVWFIGTMVRTAWIDRGIEDYPRAASTDGYIYFHEFGQDDGSTNPPAPIPAFIESSPIEIGQGDQFGFVWRMIPDLDFRNSSAFNPTVDLTLEAQDFSGSTFSQTANNNTTRSATVPVEQFTQQTYFRLRGRMLSLRVESSGVGVAWRLGIPRIDVRPDGRR